MNMRSKREHVYNERRRESYLQVNVDNRLPVSEKVVLQNSVHPFRVYNRHRRELRNSTFRTRIGIDENDDISFTY